MIDLDALGKEENANWVWHGVQPFKPGYKLALVSLCAEGLTRVWFANSI